MINRIITLILLALAGLGAQAQDGLSTQRLATIRAACFAVPACAADIAAGNPAGVLAWANGATATRGWLTAAPPAAMRQAPTYTTYDSLIAGKRDSWVLFLADPQDCTRARIRSWVTDVWGAATAASNAEAVLLACTEFATAAQVAIGGTTRTTGTVSALDRLWAGQVGELDSRRLVFRDDGTIWTP